MNSKEKGKRGELELVKFLNARGYETRRTVQYCGSNGDADVIGLPGIHIECKRVESLNLDKALEQAKKDAPEHATPAVFHRKNRMPWKVTMELEEWLYWYQKAMQTIQGGDACGRLD